MGLKTSSLCLFGLREVVGSRDDVPFSYISLRGSSISLMVKFDCLSWLRDSGDTAMELSWLTCWLGGWMATGENPYNWLCGFFTYAGILV
jgi:hypothetical protein